MMSSGGDAIVHSCMEVGRGVSMPKLSSEHLSIV